MHGAVRFKILRFISRVVEFRIYFRALAQLLPLFISESTCSILLRKNVYSGLKLDTLPKAVQFKKPYFIKSDFTHHGCAAVKPRGFDPFKVWLVKDGSTMKSFVSTQFGRLAPFWGGWEVKSVSLLLSDHQVKKSDHQRMCNDHQKITFEDQKKHFLTSI